MNFREKILGNTVVYKTFKNLVASPSRASASVHEFFGVEDGTRVLDLGCGYGDVAHYYAGRCKYLGVDSNMA